MPGYLHICYAHTQHAVIQLVHVRVYYKMKMRASERVSQPAIKHTLCLADKAPLFCTKVSARRVGPFAVVSAGRSGARALVPHEVQFHKSHTRAQFCLCLIFRFLESLPASPLSIKRLVYFFFGMSEARVISTLISTRRGLTLRSEWTCLG